MTTTGDRDMEWRPGDEDRRRRAEDHVVYERKPSGIERWLGNILQAIIIGGLVWVGTSVLGLREGAIRIEEQNKALNAAISRIETELSTMRKQLQITDTAMQAHNFRLDDHERRIKGLELVKERMR